MSVYSVCPHCYKTDGYLNVGRSHYGTCNMHRVKWHIGANVFSSWQYEAQADWDRNEQQLANFAHIEAAIDPVIEAGSAMLKLRDLLASLYGTRHFFPWHQDASPGDLLAAAALAKHLQEILVPSSATPPGAAEVPTPVLHEVDDRNDRRQNPHQQDPSGGAEIPF